MAQPDGIISDPGNPAAWRKIQEDRGQYRQEKEQAAELRVERARAQVELPDISNLGGGRP
jgi:hypothetical protein